MAVDLFGFGVGVAWFFAWLFGFFVVEWYAPKKVDG